MRRLVLILAFGLAWVASATASASPLPSSLLFFDGINTSNPNGQALAWGHLETSNVHCLSGRKIDVYFRYAGSTSYGRVDRAISSGNGAFAGTGAATDVSSNSIAAVKYKLKKSKYGHHKICQGDVIAVG